MSENLRPARGTIKISRIEATEAPPAVLSEPRILVVDVETTSLNSERGSLLEIAAQWLSGGEGEFHQRCRMWPNAEWDPESAKIHGFTWAEANDGKLAPEWLAANNFAAWVGDGPLILAGLNPHLDRAFIHAALGREPGVTVARKIFSHRMLDLHSLAVTYAMVKGMAMPGDGLRTDDLYRVLGMEPEPRPHRAMNGVKREVEALRMLMGIPTLTEPVPYELVDDEEAARQMAGVGTGAGRLTAHYINEGASLVLNAEGQPHYIQVTDETRAFCEAAFRVLT